MTSVFTAIDLSKLPAPKVVEELAFEDILAAWKADFKLRHPDAADELDLESEPLVKLLETGAYREMILRQRVNDGARAVMTAFAQGSDQDHLAALIPLERKTIDPGDPDAVPPVDPTMESNDEFRGRMQMAPEGFSTAGPDGGYIFHALRVAGVRDASVASPNPVEVVLTVLGRTGNGVPAQSVLDEVANAVGAKMVRPLTDEVTVQGAQILEYTVAASLEFYDGPDKVVVKQTAIDAVTQYTVDRHRLGDAVTDSGLKAALHRPGVKKVIIISPAAEVSAQKNQAPYCTGITVGPA